MNGGTKKLVERWAKREELLRNGFIEEIGLPMTDTGHREWLRVQVEKKNGGLALGEDQYRWRNDFEGNEKMFWKEVKRVRKGEQAKDEMEKDVNGQLLRGGV